MTQRHTILILPLLKDMKRRPVVYVSLSLSLSRLSTYLSVFLSQFCQYLLVN